MKRGAADAAPLCLLSMERSFLDFKWRGEHFPEGNSNLSEPAHRIELPKERALKLTLLSQTDLRGCGSKRQRANTQTEDLILPNEREPRGKEIVIYGTIDPLATFQSTLSRFSGNQITHRPKARRFALFDQLVAVLQGDGRTFDSNLQRSRPDLNHIGIFRQPVITTQKIRQFVRQINVILDNRPPTLTTLDNALPRFTMT